MARPDGGASKSPPVLMLASIAIVVAALYLARDVLMPFALATLLAFLLAPLVTRVERLGAGRVASVIIIVAMSFAVVGAVGWIVAGQVLDLANRLPEYRGNIAAKVDRVRASADGLSRSREVLKEISKDLSRPATQPATAPGQPAEALGGTAGAPAAEPPEALAVVLSEPEPSPLEFLSDSISPLLGPLATAGIVIVFVIFMLVQREDLRDRLIRLVSHGRMTVTTVALDDAGGRISGYLLMQLIINITYGIPVGIGLYFIGVPNAALWGLLATVLRFLPYIGPWLAAAMPILVAFAAFDSYTPLVLTVLLYIFMEIISNNVMEPWLYGTSTGMSPVAILVAAVFWTWLWGPIGLLLATPLTVCLVVIGKYVPQLSFLGVMLNDQPVLSPPMRLYQRLLAMDRAEVDQVVAGYMKAHSLLQTYDQLLIPALGLSERDRHRGLVDEQRQQFIRYTVRSIAAGLGQTLGLEGQGIEQSAEPAAAPRKGSAAPGPRVLCLPASDEADEIVAMMLAQVLTQVTCCARYISTAALASEMIQIVQRHGSQVVCISALPPSSTSQARYLCKRLRRSMRDLQLVIGLWNTRADRARLRQRLACTDSDSVVSTLADAVARVQPLVKTLPQKPAEPAPNAGTAP
jgi:predicted PurR-regulated permease PerM